MPLETALSVSVNLETMWHQVWIGGERRGRCWGIVHDGNLCDFKCRSDFNYCAVTHVIVPSCIKYLIGLSRCVCWSNVSFVNPLLGCSVLQDIATLILHR